MIYVKSRKLVFLTFVFTMVFLFVSCVSAHSPSGMTLSFNNGTNKLNVDINHQVSNPDSHYVDNIKIKINGETVIDQDYSSQPGSSFSYTFEDVDASESDTISVTAECNQGGSISEELTVGSGEVTEAGDDGSTPGFESILLFISILALILILRRNKN